jgi:hypothetical protein
VDSSAAGSAMSDDPMLRWLGWPELPHGLRPELLSELELHGVDAMRGLLTVSPDGSHSRNALIYFGDVGAQRGQIQDSG